MNIKSFYRYLSDTTGSILVEFSLALPILMSISLGIFEFNNYIALNNKLSEIAANVACWSSVTVGTNEINDYFIGANMIGNNYNFQNKGTIIVTGIGNTGSGTTVLWRMSQGTGSSNQGSIGGAATVTLQSGEFMVIVETFYPYQPFFTYFSNILPSKTVQKIAYFQFRGNGAFTPLPS